MSEQYEMKILPEYSGNKLAVTHTATNTPVDADSIYLVVQTNINLARQVEIIEGWRRLVHHARENNVLTATALASYSIVDINTRATSNIRQATDIVGVTANDLVIGIGANIVIKEDGFTNIIENAFTQLIDWVRENGVPVLS